MTSPGALRHLAERFVRSRLLTHGYVATCAQIFYGCDSDIVYANEGEPWPTFVDFAIDEMGAVGGFAVVFFRQWSEGEDVRILIQHRDAPVSIELCVPATVEVN